MAGVRAVCGGAVWMQSLISFLKELEKQPQGGPRGRLRARVPSGAEAWPERFSQRAWQPPRGSLAPGAPGARRFRERSLGSVGAGPASEEGVRIPTVVTGSACPSFRMTTSGALFPSLVPGSRGSSNKYLVEFRAGKMSLKGTTVTPDKRKGLVYIQQTDDSLIHFCWKDRTSGNVEDVSVLAPHLEDARLAITAVRP